MHRIYSAVILDDDPDAIAFMRWFMEEHFPWVRVATGTEADAVKGFDIYFIDNNFHGKARAVEIVKALRETEKDAMIIAYSATMDAKTFKALLNAGCNGAAEKGNAGDMAVIGHMVKDFIEKRSAEALSSHGPFLFKQERAGLGGKPFKIYKVRTMTMGSEEKTRMGTQLTSSHITRIGKVLRVLKLDELPQLVNIALGEMEIVGPRPIPAALDEHLCQAIPGFALRYQVRPGLTNLGQVCIVDNALDEKLVEDWRMRFESDLHYLGRKSTTYDLIMIGLTVLYLFTRFKLIRPQHAAQAIQDKKYVATSIIGTPIANLDYTGVVNQIDEWVKQKKPETLKSLPQYLPEPYEGEIRVVDNDVNRSAEPVVRAFAAQSRIPTHYLVEPEQNIALARNRAIDLSEADYIVFIDDDEIANRDWLNHLILAAQETHADAVIGPVIGMVPCEAPAWCSSGHWFDKPVPDDNGAMRWSGTRTSNTLVRGRWFYRHRLRFDPGYGRSGGSDVALFKRIAIQGGQFHAASQAVVYESVESERASLSWLVKRFYRSGIVYGRVRYYRPKLLPALDVVSRFIKICILLPKGLLMLFKKEPNGLIRVLALAALIPYRKPVFQRLAATPGWDFHVLINAASEFDRSWGVETDGLQVHQSKTWSIKRTVRSTDPVPFDQVITLHLPRSLWSDLKQLKPDVVISHELGPRTMLAAAYCRRHNIPLVIWAYQSRVSATQSNGIKNMVRRTLLKQANAVVGMGTQAREVLQNLGVDEARIVDAPNSADVDQLAQRLAREDTHAATQQIRQQYGDGRKLACVFGRLVPLKGTSTILDHWQALPASVRKQWRLVFVGEGPLAQLVTELNDPGIVHAGVVSPDQMAAWYQATDLHIFPTLGDVWGLVVNEAMQCGVPTLCSCHAGCAEDLIQDGVDGFHYDPVSEQAIHKLEQALAHPGLDAMGRLAKTRIRTNTPDRLADAFREAVHQADRQAFTGPGNALA
eukprot:g12148.t1